MVKTSKIITFHAPLSQVGQTTIVNAVAYSLAQQGNYVVILELSRYTGMSVFLNRGLGNLKNGLKQCLIDPSKVSDNLVESRVNPRVFYLCQNSKATASDLVSYNQSNIDNIITELQGAFDYILVDLPSDINDPAVVRVLSSEFSHEISHRVSVITENVLALKKLNDYDNIIFQSVTNTSKREKTTLVVNKSRNRYSPAFEPYLSGMPYSEIVNLINLVEVDEMVYLCNEGNLLSMGKTKEAKEYLSSIDMISKIITDGIEGVGVSRSSKVSKTQRKMDRANISSSKNKGKKFSLFGGKKGTKAPKAPKPPKKNRFNKKNNKQENNQMNFGNQDANFGNVPNSPPYYNENYGNPNMPMDQGGFDQYNDGNGGY